MDLHALLRSVLDVDPITHSWEGLDDGCLWCGAAAIYPWTSEHWQAHAADCRWVGARRALGLPLEWNGQRHAIRYGVPLPS